MSRNAIASLSSSEATSTSRDRLPLANAWAVSASRACCCRTSASARASGLPSASSSSACGVVVHAAAAVAVRFCGGTSSVARWAQANYRLTRRVGQGELVAPGDMRLGGVGAPGHIGRFYTTRDRRVGCPAGKTAYEEAYTPAWRGMAATSALNEGIGTLVLKMPVEDKRKFFRAAFETITLDGQGRGTWRKRSVKAYELSSWRERGAGYLHLATCIGMYVPRSRYRAARLDPASRVMQVVRYQPSRCCEPVPPKYRARGSRPRQRGVEQCAEWPFPTSNKPRLYNAEQLPERRHYPFSTRVAVLLKR